MCLPGYWDFALKPITIYELQITNYENLSKSVGLGRVFNFFNSSPEYSGLCTLEGFIWQKPSEDRIHRKNQ